jgi:hypothetical protein
MKDNNNLLFLKSVKERIPNDIRKQAEWWGLYAKLSPAVFTAVAFLLWFFGFVNEMNIMYAALGIFAITAVTWWFWTVHTIGRIGNKIEHAERGVEDVLSDIKLIRDIVREIRNNQK